MKIKNLALSVLAALTAAGMAAVAQTDTNTVSTNAPPASTNADQSAATVTNAPAAAETNVVLEITPTNAVRMNFHDVPLNTVLNYLSARMGFVISSDVDVRGNATMVSEQPIGTNDVILLLSSALAKNNYSVTRDGRILTITTADTAKSQAPVRTATTPADVPVNDEMATFILPVHTLNPTQLIKDLDQLIPPGATVAANEAGNAIIMTARQKDIHRFSEIISALDGSSVADVGVFILQYADAKSVADELKEIFQSPDSTVARSDARTRFRGFGGGGFGGGGFGGGGGDSSSTGAESKNAANKAVFTSDDQMNAVIASAPSDYFRGITNVIEKLDQPSQEISVIKSFRLKYADPLEMADELSNLFPDESSQNNNQSNRSMGTRFLPPWMQQQQTPGSAKSPRMTIQTLVRSVADERTHTLIVTASTNQMEQITQMIEDLDKDPAGKQHVYAYKLSTADPVTVQAALTALFAGENTKTQSTTQNASPLATRVQNSAQQQTTPTTSGFGGSSSGSPAIP